MPVDEEGPAEPATGERPAPNRARVYVAAVLAAGLVVAILVVVLAGSGGSGAAAADERCIAAWNSDETMIAFGQHQFGGHGYERVEVLRVTEDGQPTDAESGLCAVVFAAEALDPEPGARAQVQLDGRWTGFESLGRIGEQQIAKLQADAFAAVNARLTAEGRLAPSAS